MMSDRNDELGATAMRCAHCKTDFTTQQSLDEHLCPPSAADALGAVNGLEKFDTAALEAEVARRKRRRVTAAVNALNALADEVEVRLALKDCNHEIVLTTTRRG